MNSRIKYDPFLNKLDKKETLKDALSVGNATEGFDLQINHGDNIIGEPSGNGINGGDVNILAGLSQLGEGGDLVLGGGASVNDKGGDVFIAGGTGDNGGDVFIGAGSPISSGTFGNIFIDGFKWPEIDGASGYVLTTDGSQNLSFQPIPTIDSVSADLVFLSGAIDNNTNLINEISGDISFISGEVDNNTTNISIISGDIIQLSANIVTTKDSVNIDSLSSEFFAFEPVQTFNTAKWLITAVNPVSSTMSVFEVLGTQINNVPRHSRGNILMNELDIITDVIISGSNFGVTVTNNENENIDIEYIRIT